MATHNLNDDFSEVTESELISVAGGMLQEAVGMFLMWGFMKAIESDDPSMYEILKSNGLM
jgi:hypothetical protein